MTFGLTWDLESLMPHPESAEFSAVLRDFRRRLEQTAETSNSLPPVAGDPRHVNAWAGFLAEYAALETLADDLDSLVACHAAADAENAKLQQLEALLSAWGPLRQQMTTNLEFALREASDDDFQAFIDASSKLREVEYFLRERRRLAAIRLPKDQELLAAELAVDGIHAWGRFYDRISGRLRVQIMERGEFVEKSVGQVEFDSPQRAVRENNFFAADKAWSRIADDCADALNHIAGARLTIYRQLGLADPLIVPCLLNRMRRETLDAMWSAVRERKPCLAPYLDAKAQALGLKKLAWCDLSAPFPREAGGGDGKFPYQHACETIFQALDDFSPDFGAFARRAIESRWIEAENRSGKRQGGFCTDFPGSRQTRVFMTYTDSAGSMSTLAHELGHAYHTHALADQSVLLRRYPMNLAETASTFAEAVLGRQRLRAATSKGEQLEILDGMLSDAVAYLMNIHARFLFEEQLYQIRRDGEVPAARLSEMMLAAQQEAFMDGLAADGWNPNFWISKLHFYFSGVPFYNFPYTFGYLLSLGIYALGADGGDGFPEQYRRLLRATGCQDAEDAVLATFGYDLSDAQFWHKSLDVVEQRVERFLRLLE